MAKKASGQRNFYRFVAVLGVLFIAGMGYAFLGAAPNLSPIEPHKTLPSTEKCLTCHVQVAKNTPIMPHRPMGSCTFCHRPSETD